VSASISRPFLVVSCNNFISSLWAPLPTNPFWCDSPFTPTFKAFSTNGALYPRVLPWSGSSGWSALALVAAVLEPSGQLHAELVLTAIADRARLRSVRRSRSFKVTDFVTTRKLVCDILCRPTVLHHFQVIADYWLKVSFSIGCWGDPIHSRLQHLASRNYKLHVRSVIWLEKHFAVSSQLGTAHQCGTQRMAFSNIVRHAVKRKLTFFDY